MIRTWFITKSFLLFTNCILIHRCHEFLISKTHSSVTSLPCWGRVVIGSLVVYQTTGAGSNPVASTTVLTVSARSIGNDQKNCSSYAWEGLERSGPFPILLELQIRRLWVTALDMIVVRSILMRGHT